MGAIEIALYAQITRKDNKLTFLKWMNFSLAFIVSISITKNSFCELLENFSDAGHATFSSISSLS